jgi:hypothetical protein
VPWPGNVGQSSGTAGAALKTAEVGIPLAISAVVPFLVVFFTRLSSFIREVPLVVIRKPRRIDGNVENIRLPQRFLQLRFGKQPGEYLILYVPKTCFIHRMDGQRLPLRDVQFCDNVSIWYQQHPRFKIKLAQEIEVC